MMYVWDTIPAEELGKVSAAVTAVLASGITAETVQHAMQTYPAAVEMLNNLPKNVLQYATIGTPQSHDVEYTTNGITFTVKSDGTIEATGKATANAYAYLIGADDAYAYIDDYCNGNFTISGCPEGGSTTTYRIWVGKTGYRNDEFGKGKILPDNGDVTNIYAGVYISKDFDIGEGNKLIFKPMICTNSAYQLSKEYEPYMPTYAELYARVQALENA